MRGKVFYCCLDVALFFLPRVISSGRDVIDSATVLGDVGTNEHLYALLLGVGKVLILHFKMPLSKEEFHGIKNFM